MERYLRFFSHIIYTIQIYTLLLCNRSPVLSTSEATPNVDVYSGASSKTSYFRTVLIFV